MLTSVALCLALCTGDGLPGKEAAAARPFHEIQADLSDFLKREALTKDAAERAKLIRQLCDLHHEILHHPRHETAEAMKGYRVQAWSRLKRVQADLKNQLARERKGKNAPVGTDPQLLAASDSLAAALNLADSSLGGPSALLARGGRAQIDDNGQELVDLIERTINPDFWDTNGGPGTIVYFAPLQCLVITATGEMHQNAGGLLGGLRAAGN
ncbi:hypothetical protein NA78x_001275 [Anatilimnocola sp. NA78]|uniref:hypothetical protein n=1 Tax=Anatilimnocola sp. NA78 TaxID=3415683 RepID=UPI003CE45A9E